MNKKRLLKSVIAVTCAVMIAVCLTACSARNDSASVSEETAADAGRSTVSEAEDSVTGRVTSIDGEKVTIETREHKTGENNGPPEMNAGGPDGSQMPGAINGKPADANGSDRQSMNGNSPAGQNDPQQNGSGSDIESKDSARKSGTAKDSSSRPEKKTRPDSASQKQDKVTDEESSVEKAQENGIASGDTDGRKAAGKTDSTELKQKTSEKTDTEEKTGNKPASDASEKDSDPPARPDESADSQDQMMPPEANGSLPDAQQNTNPPAMPDGMNGSQEQPMPPEANGTAPDMQQGSEPPAMPDETDSEEAPQGTTGKTIVLDLSAAMFDDGSPVRSADDLKEGDMIRVEFDENGNIVSITIITPDSSVPGTPDGNTGMPSPENAPGNAAGPAPTGISMTETEAQAA